MRIFDEMSVLLCSVYNWRWMMKTIFMVFSSCYIWGGLIFEALLEPLDQKLAAK